MPRGLLALLLVLAACGPATVQPVANPVRQGLEAALKEARDQPLSVRWNPAPCACPPFELQVGAQWLRADLAPKSADVTGFSEWIQLLAASPMEVLPVSVAVQGRIDAELLRTANGVYAVRIEVSRVLAPLPPQAPTGPAEGTAPTTGAAIEKDAPQVGPAGPEPAPPRKP